MSPQNLPTLFQETVRRSPDKKALFYKEAGKYRSEADLKQSARGAGVKAYLNSRGDRILKALDEVAARRAASLAQVSLAWLMSRPGITAPIASATSVAQLRDIAAATRLVLTSDDLTLLDSASAL